jgi:hypothetical protein
MHCSQAEKGSGGAEKVIPSMPTVVSQPRGKGATGTEQAGNDDQDQGRPAIVRNRHFMTGKVMRHLLVVALRPWTCPGCSIACSARLHSTWHCRRCYGRMRKQRGWLYWASLALCFAPFAHMEWVVTWFSCLPCRYWCNIII